MNIHFLPAPLPRIFLSALVSRVAGLAPAPAITPFANHHWPLCMLNSATICAPADKIKHIFPRAGLLFAAEPRKTSYKLQSMALGPSGTAQILPPEQVDEDARFWEQVQAHQKAAAKLSHLEEARLLVDTCSHGTLSTISEKYEQFPVGSLVQFATDSYGRPILAVTTLSPHTKDLGKNPKCSLMVPKDAQNKSTSIVTVVGDAYLATEQEWGELRAAYLKKFPDAVWVDFGDFRIFRIEPRHVRFVTGLATGFAAVADFSGEEYKDANVDTIAQFSAPISTHMNKDHAKDTQRIVEHSVGVKVDYAKILDLDRLGLNVQVAHNGQPLNLRIPFPRPAQDRKDVKMLIVEMLHAATEADKST